MDSELFNKLILTPFFLALIISLISTPLAIKLAWRFGLIDDPKKRRHPAHTHQGKVPRGGGLPIFLALLVSSLILLPLDQHLKGILAGASVMLVTGLLDDRFDLNPYWRLGACFLAAGLVVFSGIGITFITNPFDGVINLTKPIATLVALFWIVFLSSARKDSIPHQRRNDQFSRQ